MCWGRGDRGGGGDGVGENQERTDAEFGRREERGRDGTEEKES